MQKFISKTSSKSVSWGGGGVEDPMFWEKL